MEDSSSSQNVVAASLAGRSLRRPDAPAGALGDRQDHGVDVALNLIVATAAAIIRTADGVSITVGRYDDFATVVASDQRVYSMDVDQYELAEGPCLSAALKVRRFHAPCMDEETRWPQFTARARQRGINAILSTPLFLDGEVRGALNIYSKRPFAFGGPERATASAFATQASAVLQAQAQGDISVPALSEGLQSALGARELEAFRRAATAWTSLTSEAGDVGKAPPKSDLSRPEAQGIEVADDDRAR